MKNINITNRNVYLNKKVTETHNTNTLLFTKGLFYVVRHLFLLSVMLVKRTE